MGHWTRCTVAPRPLLIHFRVNVYVAHVGSAQISEDDSRSVVVNVRVYRFSKNSMRCYLSVCIQRLILKSLLFTYNGSKTSACESTSCWERRFNITPYNSAQWKFFYRISRIHVNENIYNNASPFQTAGAQSKSTARNTRRRQLSPRIGYIVGYTNRSSTVLTNVYIGTALCAKPDPE